ncbi:MAG: hypothetical protein MZV64_01615 [Ignavibacteriales bacterium]|nr:hypothetical protein [Ignavibacteriales bacterium]
MFEKDLNSSLKHRGFLRAVVQQLIHTTGQGSRWPTVIVDDEFLKRMILDETQVMNEFLRKNDYREVWKNECFRILVPRTNNNFDCNQHGELKSFTNNLAENIRYASI